MIYCFDTLASTNSEAQDERYGDGDVVVARRQTAGRGQRTHSWNSEGGKNLTFTIVLTDLPISVREQFVLSQTAALAVVDTLAEHGIEARVKWTNDIYVGDRKICGILIENRLQGEHWARAVIGIGLNINQLQFSQELLNPTSMALERGQEFDIEDILQSVLAHFNVCYSQPREAINEAYNRLLYRLNEPHRYIFGDRDTIGIIRGVEPTGELVMEVEGEKRTFLYGEVNFILP